eukprot:6461369-Amphidinium_carterae.1
MADRLHWTPTQTGWRQGDQYFSWDEADYKVKRDSALQLCKEVADARPDFQGLASGLSMQALKQLKLAGQSQKDTVNSALNAARGCVWHEVLFAMSETCVFAVEKLWRTLSTLCINVLLGRLKGVRLRFRPTPKRLLL